MSSIWTEERIELIKERWNDGYSATQIAAELSEGATPQELPISRNAVIGKIHRLGLVGPNTQGPNSVTKFRSTRLHPARPTKRDNAKQFTPRVINEPAPEAVGPWDEFCADGFCKDIAQHPAIQSWRCCGHTATKGAYCDHHARVNHQQKPAHNPNALEASPDPVPVDDKVGDGVAWGGIKPGSKLANLRKRAA